MTKDIHEQQIADIEKHGSNLSEWEEKFIDGLAAQLMKGKSLSIKQAENLERIYDERVG